MFVGIAVSASPKYLFAIKIIRSHPRSIESETPRVGSAIVLTYPGDSDSCQNLRTTA